MQPQLKEACSRALYGKRGVDSSNTTGGMPCGLVGGNPAELEALNADPVQCLVARMVASVTGRSFDGEPYSSKGLGRACRTALAGVLRRRQVKWRLDRALEAACRWGLGYRILPVCLACPNSYAQPTHCCSPVFKLPEWGHGRGLWHVFRGNPLLWQPEAVYGTETRSTRVSSVQGRGCRFLTVTLLH